eukprot:1162000-Pelagomonas_calceolata.AAC.7
MAAAQVPAYGGMLMRTSFSPMLLGTSGARRNCRAKTMRQASISMHKGMAKKSALAPTTSLRIMVACAHGHIHLLQICPMLMATCPQAATL